jgi:hypothetical protein
LSTFNILFSFTFYNCKLLENITFFTNGKYAEGEQYSGDKSQKKPTWIIPIKLSIADWKRSDEILQILSPHLEGQNRPGRIPWKLEPILTSLQTSTETLFTTSKGFL